MKKLIYRFLVWAFRPVFSQLLAEHLIEDARRDYEAEVLHHAMIEAMLERRKNHPSWSDDAPWRKRLKELDAKRAARRLEEAVESCQAESESHHATASAGDTQ